MEAIRLVYERRELLAKSGRVVVHLVLGLRRLSGVKDY